MSAVATNESPAVLREDTRRGSRLRSRASAAAVALAWLAVLATAATALEQAGAPPRQVLAYLAAWVLGCTFPGVMVWRALTGHSTLVKELGFGSALGIVLQLVIWAVATAVHRPWVMLALPFGVVAVFLFVPGLRQHWWPRRPVRMRTPARWHVAMAVVVAMAVYRFERVSGVRRVLPPAPSVVNRDTWYNSALSYELGRTLRPQDPFAVGEPLRYHWFADAHVTATAQLSGVPIATAMITLWLVPMLVVLLLVVAAATQQFMDGSRADGAAVNDVRRWWVGPVAAFFTLVSPALWRFGNPGAERTADGFVASSPSGILAIVLILGLVAPMLDLLRGRACRGTWVVLLLLLGACVGTKPSILPVVACGATVVLVSDLIRHRRLNRPMAVVLGVAITLVVVAAPVLAGSTGGSHFQLLALVTVDPSYARLLGGQPVFPAAGGWLVPALAQQLPHAVPVIAMLLVVWVLTETPRLLSLAGVFVRPMRTDPGVLWGCGVVAGGYASMWALAHPGYSEHYFWTVTIGLSTVMTVTNAARVLPAQRRARTLAAPLLAVAVLGVAAGYATTTFGRVNLDAPVRTVIEGRLRPFALVVPALVVAVLVTVLLRMLSRRWTLPLLTAATAFCLAAGLPVTFSQLSAAQPPRMQPLPKVGASYLYVAPEQERAALWLQRHSAPTAVVATNMFCWPMGKDTPHCRINSAWLGGLTGRRMVLGDWTYTSVNMSHYDGTAQLDSMPAPWPERRSLSTEAVAQPTPQLLGRLRREYGARWIFADTRATTISPRLTSLAALRYTSAHIRIYRLHDSYAP